MQPLESLVVDDAFCERVRLLVGRIEPVTLVTEPKWSGFAERLGLRSSTTTNGTPLLVGPPATVLRHARTASDAIGFVMPVARSGTPWRRWRWRDEATLDLWRLGFTPINVDRLLVASDRGSVEFVIGDARPTPASPNV